MMKDLLRIADLSSADLELLLDQAASAVTDPHQHADLLRGDTVALYFATPYGLEPHPEVVARARALAAQHGSRVELTLNPTSAVRDADAVFTDAWLSMHDPASARAARIHVLAPFRVDRRLLAGAKPDALFLHCLPAYRGEEVTDEVIDGPRSLVLDQAANLLPIAQALLYLLLEGRLQGHTDTMTVPDDTGRLAAAITAAVKSDAIGDQVTPAARLRSPGTGSGRVWVGRWGRTRIIRVTSDDEAIRREVVDEVLVRTLWIEPPTVTVTVQDGIVTLSGRLERKSLVSMAVHLTRRVPGVVDVVSQLSFDWDDDRPEPARVRAWAP